LVVKCIKKISHVDDEVLLKRLTKRSALRERNNWSWAARVDSDKVLRPAARLMLANNLLSSDPIVLRVDLKVDLPLHIHFIM
jgi:hypothetical protein